MIFFRRSIRNRIGPVEKGLNALFLLVLAAIGGWVHHQGQQADPDLFRLKDASLAEKGTGQTIYVRPPQEFTASPEGGGVTPLLTADLMGPGWRREGPVEIFGYDRLYEKINGREGLYKSYGFQKLWAATYAAGLEAGAVVDLEVFRHATTIDAFGVFSTERRGLPEGGGKEANRAKTPNGLYMVQGTYYVRLIGSEESDAIRSAVERAAAALENIEARAQGSATKTPASPGPKTSNPLASPAPESPGAREPESGIPESLLSAPDAWTPANNPLLALGASPASLRYQAENGLGMAFFERLYTATFSIDGQEVRAYLVAAESQDEARDLHRRYSAYLLEQGAAADLSGWPDAPTGSVAVRDRLLDTWEWVFAVDRFVAGVTETENQEAAARVVIRLGRSLQSRR